MNNGLPFFLAVRDVEEILPQNMRFEEKCRRTIVVTAGFLL